MASPSNSVAPMSMTPSPAHSMAVSPKLSPAATPFPSPSPSPTPVAAVLVQALAHGTLVKPAPQSATASNMEAVISAVSRLNISKPDTDEIKEDTQKKQQTKTAEKVAAISTTKIEKRANREYLRTLLGTWHKKAKEKVALAESLSDVPKARIENAEEAVEIIGQMKTGESFPQKGARVCPYIAYDQSHKIQTIALCEFAKHKPAQLNFIATCPDNIILLDTDTGFRGGATALIVRIVTDIMARKNEEDLDLESVPSALPFYMRLGFEVSQRPSKFVSTIPMTLKAKNMAEFVKRNGHSSERVSEPDLRRFGFVA